METLTNNRDAWGDATLVERKLSVAAVAAAGFGILAFGLGPVVLLLPLPQVVSLVTFLPALASMIVALPLSYVALYHCRVDGPRGGRGWAWAGCFAAYLSLVFWSGVFLGFDVGSLWYWLLGLVIFVHLVKLAIEAPGFRQLFALAVLGVLMFGSAALVLNGARQTQRREGAINNLRHMGFEIQARERHRPPKPQSAESDWAQLLLPDDSASPSESENVP